MNYHEHIECDHEVAYCKKCKLVYCKKCGKEWVERWNSCYWGTYPVITAPAKWPEGPRDPLKPMYDYGTTSHTHIDEIATK